MTEKKRIILNNNIIAEEPVEVKVNKGVVKKTRTKKTVAGKKAKYIEAWAELRVPIEGREIVYGAKASVGTTDTLAEVQDSILIDCLTNLNNMIEQLQKK